MTSEVKAASNRRNAARSTGPRTSEGKTRAAQNARRHGLNVDAPDNDPVVTAILQALRPEPHSRGAARTLALAQERLRRIRAAKAAATVSPPPDLPDNLTPEDAQAYAYAAAANQLLRLDDYERKALSRRKRAIRELKTPGW